MEEDLLNAERYPADYIPYAYNVKLPRPPGGESESAKMSPRKKRQAAAAAAGAGAGSGAGAGAAGGDTARGRSTTRDKGEAVVLKKVRGVQ